MTRLILAKASLFGVLLWIAETSACYIRDALKLLSAARTGTGCAFCYFNTLNDNHLLSCSARAF